MTSLPLDLADVLAAEGRAIDNEFAVPIPFDVKPHEIVDGPNLAARLTNTEDGKRIAALFTSEGRSFLEEWRSSTREEICNTLAVELTRLLDNPEVFDTIKGPLQKHTRLLFDDPDTFDNDDLHCANRMLLDDVFAGQIQPVMIRRRNEVFTAIHQSAPRSALCLSGGGIRSATFALGILQGLAHYKLLQKFDYLSTVSGGGYIGGWLTAWIHRHRNGPDGVVDALAASSRFGSDGAGRRAAPEEPPEIEHLRTYSNYLTPKLGLSSADAWTVMALIGRNLFLNWLLIVPLAVTVAALPLLFASMLRETWAGSPWVFTVGVVGLITCIAYINLERPSTSVKDWPPRWFRWFCWLPLVISAMALTAYWSAVAESVRAAGWVTPFLRWRLPLLAVVVGLGVFVNVSGWIVWVFTPRWREHPHRFFELLFAVGAGAAGGALTFLLATRVFPIPGKSPAELAAYASFCVPLFLMMFMLAETLFAGGVSRWTNDEDREWWARAAAWILMIAIGWAVLVPIVFFGPVLLTMLPQLFAGLGGISGIVSVAIARSEKTSAVVKEAVRSRRALNATLAVSGPLFLAISLSAVSLGTVELLHFVDFGRLLPLTAFRPFAPLGASGTHPVVALTVANRSATLALFGAIAFTICMIVSYFLDINKFSLHSLYRNRLIRAYLGASNRFRKANQFTGFDEQDNLELQALRDLLYMRRANVLEPGRLMERLRGDACEEPYAFLKRQLRAETLEAIRGKSAGSKRDAIDLIVEDVNRLLERRDLHQIIPVTDTHTRLHPLERIRLRYVGRSASMDHVLRENRKLLYETFSQVFGSPKTVPKPLHIINTTLNLVGGSRLAWQQRKAEPFSMSPLHCGSFRVGYRDAADYAARVTTRGHEDGITLGTAVAISGAAASPNMGYHSSPSATLLMTLFNARLGWWLGNSGVAGRTTFTNSHPQLAIQPLIAEAFGRTTDTNKYIYLSDGGHFENLGLYEAVLRRCHLVVVSDCSCDGDFKFDELGNAIRKIRIDLGIAIDFDKGIPIGGKDGHAYCAIGRIGYSAVDAKARDGVLVYIKPAVYGKEEPRDVMNYQTTTDKKFPHESTSDQWFSETQFESYRALGWYVIDKICRDHACHDLVDFAESSYQHAYPEANDAGWLDELRRVATIQFEPSRCEIVAAQQKELQRVAEMLRRKSYSLVSLVGRRAAQAESDATISQRRAYAVAAALEGFGLHIRFEIAGGDKAARDRTELDTDRVDVFVR